jgi:hypothetical protein
MQQNLVFIKHVSAEEIDFLAQEEYNTELNTRVAQTKSKRDNDNEIQRHSIEREAKIKFSVVQNQKRLKFLKDKRGLWKKYRKQQRSINSISFNSRVFQHSPWSSQANVEYYE